MGEVRVDADRARPIVRCGEDRSFGAGALLLRVELSASLLRSAPHGWTVAEAQARPLTTAELLPALEAMAATQGPGDEWYVNYLQRAAMLTRFLYEDGPWSSRSCKGAAWGTLMVGLQHHRFAPRGAAALFFYKPEPDFFERLPGVDALANALEGAFRLPQELVGLPSA